MRMKESARRLLLVTMALVSVLAGLAAAHWWQRFTAPAVTALPEWIQRWDSPRSVVWPVLTDQSGQTFDVSRLPARRTLVLFGYLSCPDICPLTLAELHKALQAAQGGEDALNILYVTVDPQRDTPERLAGFLSAFNPDWIGLTGSEEALTDLAAQLNNVFFSDQQGDEPHYTVSHSSVMALLDSRQRFIAQLRQPEQPGRISAFLAHLL